MFKNYLKTALRTFRKNKTTTTINILGLSIGISAALIIFMMVDFDFSFDKYEPDNDRIYRIVTDGQWKNQGVPSPLQEEVQQHCTGIDIAVPIFDYYEGDARVFVQHNNKKPSVFFKQDKIAFTRESYFSMFPHQWLAGNPKSSLKNPYDVVLSESRAKMYFPDLSPDQVIGKILVFSDTLNTVVKGIVKDLEANSDFKYQVFISLATLSNTNQKENYNWNQWTSTNSNTQLLVKLLPNVHPPQIDKQLSAIFKKHNADPEDAKTLRRLQALSDVHTNPDYGGTVNKATVNNLILLAVFLLLLGVINFINLSTAHAAERAKEIGIRKTLGSKKHQLIWQFLSETFLLTLLTALLSLVITPLLFQAFTGFIPDGLKLGTLLGQPVVWAFLCLLVIFVSFAAGLYPAFILTKFKPISVLKNSVSTTGGTSRDGLLRKILILSQFVIAQIFLIGMMVVNKQIHYSMQKDMGFRKDAIINFYLPFDFNHPNKRKFILQDEIRKMPEVLGVSLGNQSPAFNGQMSSIISFMQKGKSIKLEVDVRSGDTAFIGVYNIKLVAGRNILASDTANELLVNETLAKQLGFSRPNDAIGHFATYGESQLPIVGVMADFNLASVRTAIHPLIYFAAPKNGYVMHVELQNDPMTWKRATRKMEAAWKTEYPETIFEYTFLDKTIAGFYKEDQQLSTLLIWSSGISVFISCLGLFGLVIFMTNNRVKEIGIRKILGASVTQIIALLSRDFMQLLALAILIAIPIAWWTTHNWLQNFAYHTDLNWLIFAIGALSTVITALLIVSLRAGKAAIANPVKSLRAE